MITLLRSTDVISNFCGHVYMINHNFNLFALLLCAPVTELAPLQLQPAEMRLGVRCDWQDEAPLQHAVSWQCYAGLETILLS